MPKKTLILMLFFFTACATNQLSENEFFVNNTTCPHKIGKVILPAYFQAAHIFVGKSPEREHDAFIDQLLRVSSSLSKPPNITIALPNWFPKRTQQIEAFTKSRPSMRIKWLQTSSENTTWIQDYFEPIFDIQKKKIEFIEVPYGDDGKKVLEAIASSEQSAVLKKPMNLPLDQNGNFGGNIEAVGTDTVIVGNNMSPTFRDFLQRTLSQKILEIDTSWLETGHVDEIFSIVRTSNLDEKCQFILLYADPDLAIELIQKSEQKALVSYSNISGSQYIRSDISRCLGEVSPRIDKKFEIRCPELVQANKTYRNLIKRDLWKILQSARKERSCQFKKAVPIPVLFSPDKIQTSYGTSSDYALAVNSNGVNGVAIENFFILPQQSLETFGTYIKNSLERHKVNVVFSRSQHLQRLYGGIHCNVNIARSCDDKFSD